VLAALGKTDSGLCGVDVGIMVLISTLAVALVKGSVPSGGIAAAMNVR